MCLARASLGIMNAVFDNSGHRSFSRPATTARPLLRKGMLIVPPGDRPAGDSNTDAILLLLSLPHPRGIGLGPNGIAPEARLKERFLKQEGSQDSDYGPAIASAIEQGWVMRISDRIRLTAEGHKVSIGRL